MDTRDAVQIVVGMIAAGGWIAVWRLWQRVRLLEGRVEPLEKRAMAEIADAAVQSVRQGRTKRRG